MIRVLIADDHPVVRKGLKQILAEVPDIEVTGEASDARELIENVQKEICDIILLDITMPGRGGLDALKELRRDFPTIPVLVLSMHPEDQYGVRVLKSGAAGYMTKESAPEELVEAIKKVHGGGKYLSPYLAEKLAFELVEGSDKPPHERLSDREFEILRLIASGKTVSQIASILSLSVKTISTYRARILEKMTMKTNAELTHYAIHNKLVD
ncbi:MAG: response regulator transcription factor [Deltaproteobacteria bacterium]|nr:response regulator transcription factor [Deltaproteobacteria bacterium]